MRRLEVAAGFKPGSVARAGVDGCDDLSRMEQGLKGL